MSSRRRFSLLALVAVAVASGTLLAVPGPGAGAAGETLDVEGRLISADRQSVWNFTLHAAEDDAGRGEMAFLLDGPGIGVCDAHGGGIVPGGTPLTEFECFGSFGVSVSIEGCTAELETHGIVHADHPYTVFMGPVTLDILFERLDASRNRLRVEIFTPKEPIVLAGISRAAAEMPSCS